MKELIKKSKLIFLLITLAAVVLLTGCSANVKKEKELREQAIGFMNNGDYGAAIARFNEALSMKDGRYGKLEIDILKYKAEAQVKNGDYLDADDTYKKLIETDRETAEYLNLRVICISLGEGDLQKGIELYHRAADKAKGDNDAEFQLHRQALYELGSALAKREYESYHEQAEALYVEALSNEAERSGELYNRVGMMCFEKGDVLTAIEYLEEGRAFASQYDTDEEREAMKSIDYNLAVCYEYTQDYEKALTRFEAYRDNYGSTPEVEHEITFLETRVNNSTEDDV